MKLFFAGYLFLLAGLMPEGAAASESFLFQLQNPSPAAIQKTAFPVVVIDYSKDGSAGEAFTRAKILALHASGKTVLAYISIGEAENYRFYWKKGWVLKQNTNQFTSNAPAWLGHTNPDWLGNYKVRYWDAAWQQKIIQPYLQCIVDAGFDGVYLDIVDAYGYWADAKSYGAGRETFRTGDPRGQPAVAAKRMIGFISSIAAYCRSNSLRKDAFKVVPQNAEEILAYDTDGKLMKTVTGWGVEDLWYDEIHRIPIQETNYRLKFLRRLKAHGKQVLSVDYVDNGTGFAGTNKTRIKAYRALTTREGFLGYAARSDRELNQINLIKGVQP